jgi:uncharacterized protein
MSAASDLTDAEFAQLDELLMSAPEPLRPLDAVMLDGYLCGVIVQPRLVEPAEWLPGVYDVEAELGLDDVPADWRARCEPLIVRRHAALVRSLADDGWFNPLVLEAPDDEDGVDGGTEAGAAPADAEAAAEEDDGEDDIAVVLAPWVTGFQYAASRFPELHEIEDDDVAAALARLYRHLPAETDEEREVVEMLDEEHPLPDLDAAIEDLVNAVADLNDLTSERRFHVETVRRDAPKVGRNDPCPCGSGRKYKQCHGAG